MIENSENMNLSTIHFIGIGGIGLSAAGKEAIKRMLQGQQVTREDVGMSAGEWRELLADFEIT